MARKILGYIQLVWTCTYCGTQNPGAIKSCTSCGAPQPPEVKFEKVDAEKFDLIKDEALIRMAKAGPDKHCPYCGTRNLAEDTYCKQCGSDITIGAHVRESGGKIGEESAPPPVPQKMSRTTMIILILLAVVACVFFSIFMSKLFSSETINATVTSSSWERSVEILAFTTVRKDAWYDEIPAGATIEYCESKYSHTSDVPVANSTEECGEPYTVDTGTGIGEVRQDCVYRVYEDYCTYTSEGWIVADTITLSGYDLNPRWPTTSLASNQQYGNQTESYRIIFDAGSEEYTYVTTDFDVYMQAAPGSRWELEVNGLGSVVDLSPR